MIGRRRLLTISAAAVGAALLPGPTPAGSSLRWRGHALGGDASITLHGGDAATARRTVAACVDEIERLENEFSLFRAESALRRLNRDGALPTASIDMRTLLYVARSVAEDTDGAFDVTVQPLWEAWAAGGAKVDHPPDNFRHVLIDGATVRLTRPDMALTLNGIAQGYITDRIATLLRRAEYVNVAIDMGELRVLGPKADGTPWRVGLPGGGLWPLRGGALATSGPGRTGTALFDPRAGTPSRRYRAISVAASTATEADALSTAFFALPVDAIADIAARRGVSVRILGRDDRITLLGQEAA